MKKYIKSSSQSELLYFEDYQVDNIGELVADNLTHLYRSQGADFYYTSGQQAYDYDTGKYRITIRCRVSSHYDPEVNTNSRYGAYLDSMDGKEFEATHNFSYNRYDTQDTMGRQIVIILTDDIEDQILKASGVMGCSDINASTKYTADMCSIGASDVDDDYKYYVAGYFDNLMRGLSDNLSTDSFDAALSFANELANDGLFIQIKNLITGQEQFYDANVWLDCIEQGDVPEDVFELT